MGMSLPTFLNLVYSLIPSLTDFHVARILYSFLSAKLKSWGRDDESAKVLFMQFHSQKIIPGKSLLYSKS